MINQLQVHQFACLSDNYGYLIHDPVHKVTAAIDTPDADAYFAELDKMGWRLTHIFNTHHHADHTGGNLDLKKKFGTKIYGPGIVKGRIPGLSNPLFGEEIFKLGTHDVHVLSTPGHTLDHIIYYVPDAMSAFVGDTLFALGCGRLFEGSKEDMYNSLKKISSFPDETKLYCAHEYTLSNAEFALTVEPSNNDLKKYIIKAKKLRADGLPTVPTTVDSEKKCNPFVRAVSATRLGEIRAAKDIF